MSERWARLPAGRISVDLRPKLAKRMRFRQQEAQITGQADYRIAESYMFMRD
ncbi:MAG TPA: hypothetical protein HPP97_07030 [Desulfuromonadales bacterium]|nr:hypothetical protein [Desulfuromonadales bacterium]